MRTILSTLLITMSFGNAANASDRLGFTADKFETLSLCSNLGGPLQQRQLQILRSKENSNEGVLYLFERDLRSIAKIQTEISYTNAGARAIIVPEGLPTIFLIVDAEEQNINWMQETWQCRHFSE